MLYKFDPQVYPVDLYVATKGDRVLINNSFPGLNIEEKDELLYDGMTLSAFKNGAILIWFTGKMEYSLIVHEATHVADRMLDYIGSETGIENTEQRAYLTEWVFKCCEEVKKNKVTTGKIYKNENKKTKRKSKDS